MDRIIADCSLLRDSSGRTVTQKPLRRVFTQAEIDEYNARQTQIAAEKVADDAVLAQIATDKTQVIQFMNAASGTATAAQRDDTIKAIVRYLRRRGDDA
jgi:hypothetical protein